MNKFDIKKFEENKGKQGYLNEYYYKSSSGFDVREYETFERTEKKYKQEISKEFSPVKYRNTYDPSGYIEFRVKEFNNSILKLIEYDKNGQLIKETNFDKKFRHTFEQIHDIVLKEKGIDIFDTRQAIALRHDTPNAIIKKYYQIHVLKSKLVQGEWYSQPNYSFLIDDETGKILEQKDINSREKPSSIYKTHNGKFYSQAEWEAYEEKEYKEYCKRTGKTYIPKDQTTISKNKGRFEADDTDRGSPDPKKVSGMGGFSAKINGSSSIKLLRKAEHLCFDFRHYTELRNDVF